MRSSGIWYVYDMQQYLCKEKYLLHTEYLINYFIYIYLLSVPYHNKNL